MVSKDFHRTAALRCLSRGLLASVIAVVRAVMGYTHLTVGVKGGGSPDMSGGRVTHPYDPATSSHTKKRGGRVIWDFCVLLLVISVLIGAAVTPDNASAATPPGVDIDNTATATYTFGSTSGLTSNSNTVTTTTVASDSIVFDSATGMPIDGAIVTLIDIGTGLEAINVKGDDGVSIFPGSVTSGSVVVDGGGTVYNFPAGGFRFPLLEAGTYRLDVTPPVGYTSPSTVPTATLQTLPGAPFSIVAPGSRNENFQIITPGSAIHIDLPTDPLSTTSLYVRKTASKDHAAIGDFLQYMVSVENTTAAVLTPVTVSDRLPLGIRYKDNSTTIGNAESADPLISADGRTLTFTIAALNAAETASIKYVVEISSGTQLGTSVNTATATSGGVTSNTARAEVDIKEDLLHNQTIIMGRVISGPCDTEDDSALTGVKGARIYLEDGTYVITDKEGRYHIEGVRPGAHVVQLDTETLPALYTAVLCEDNSRFAGRSFSQFVDMAKGSMWRADFHVSLMPRTAGDVSAELNSKIADNLVKYTLPIRVGDVSLSNLKVTILLPEDTTYVEGSSTLNSEEVADPDIINNNILTYRIAEAAAGTELTINFSSSVGVPKTPTIDPNEDNILVTKAYMLFDTPSDKGMRTPVMDNSLIRYLNEERVMNPAIALHPHFDILGAELSDEDKLIIDNTIDRLRDSDILHIYVTGHTDSMRIKERSRKLYKDNDILSLARARSVARYIANELKLSPSQVTLNGKGPNVPVASNETVDGRSENRRVELTVLSRRLIKYAYLIPEKEHSGEVTVETTGLRPGEATKAKEDISETSTGDPQHYKAFPIEEASKGFEILWPTRSHYPPLPSTKITIKHAPNSSYKLFMNNTEVSPLHLENSSKNKAKDISISYWRGVDLKEGDNTLEAVLYDKDGVELERVSAIVHYSSPPTDITLVKERSNLIVDGLTPPSIALRFTDKDGAPAREGITGEYTVDPPHAPLEGGEAFEAYPLSGVEKKRTKFTVGKDGIALIKLRPDSEQGIATLRFNLSNGEHVVNPWLEPKFRDWILVGFAEGTAGYNTIDDNMDSAKLSGAEDDFYSDADVTFFAKGTIKGRWLLTMIYDSGKDGFDEDELHRTIDPGTYYTIYGDKTEQKYEGASSRKLYLKIERREFYALFGDFNTGLSVTELSHYNRSMNGLKSEMRTDKFSYTAFIADTNKAFVKDELRGDGTSGLYTLSRSDIITNSESVTIEVRDRFRSEVIISAQRLTRHTDYDIDYDSSTIFFKEPVLSKDRDLNPVYIVVDYESKDSSDKSLNYGGRAEAKLLEGTVTAGVTHLHEGQLGGKGDLYGVDASINVSQDIGLKVEASRSRNDFGAATIDDSAYIAELSHKGDKTSTQAYIREYGEDFGLGQNRASENGTRKFGVSSNYRVTKRISIDGELMRQENLLTEARRTLGEFGLKYRAENYSLSGGLRSVTDRLGDGSTANSKQLTLGADWQPLPERLNLRLTHEQSIFGDDESSDYPTRTTIGADLKINRFVTIIADQEFTYGDAEDTQSTRLGLKATPWKDADLKTSIVRDSNEYGERVFSNIGLAQRLRLTERLSIDASIDYANAIKNPGNTPMNANVPLASADSEFLAISTGLAYQGNNWGTASRIEHRTSRYEDKVGLFTGVSGEIREGLGLSLGLKLTNVNSSAVGGVDKDLSELRLGFAYRPLKSRWIILDRLELIKDEADGANFNYDNRRIVNNMNANFKMDSKTQLSLQYGAKYVKDTIDGKSYSGYTDLMGMEARYDITTKWDVGARAGVLHSWESSQMDYGMGVSIGHSFAENTWVNFGYNFTGFKDSDFSGSDFMAQGPYMTFRIKFDQESVRDAVKRLSGD